MPEKGTEPSASPPEFSVTNESFEMLRTESREVVAEQLTLLRETDKKAIATTRLIALLLGLLLSAASLADDPLAFTNAAVILGGMLLFCAFVLGTFSFSVDRPAHGLGPGYFDEELPRFEQHQTVCSDLLSRYADWIDENSLHIETNGNYLLASQASLIVGLALVAAGISIEIGVI